MFQLVKAELSYNKKYIIFGLIFCSIFMLAYIASGKIELESIRYSTFSIAFWMFLFDRWGYYIFNKDNLERVHASLPLRLKSIAVARIMPGIILWLVFVTIVALTLLLNSYFTIKTLKSILFLNGLALMVNSFVYIWHDFIFIKPNKIKKRLAYAFYYLFTFTVVIVVYLSTSTTLSSLESLQDSIRGNLFTIPWIIATNIMALAFIYLNYYLYPIRSSYLHSEFGLRTNIKVKTGDIT